ncbi:hypothetical protein PINS_up007445 [Pythium insidiosum]|nr:hypothetical protein PINS_up007445 [Pythium insidiosum]
MGAKVARRSIDDDSGSEDADGEDERYGSDGATADDDWESTGGSESQLSLDDHIERMLMRTRTVALLKIANNTAEVLPDDMFEEDDDEDDEEGWYDDEADEDYDLVSEIDDKAQSKDDSASATSSLARQHSLPRMKSMRQGSFVRGNSKTNVMDAEQAAAVRLVRTLSTFLNLPKVISYNDLEQVQSIQTKMLLPTRTWYLPALNDGRSQKSYSTNRMVMTMIFPASLMPTLTRHVERTARYAQSITISQSSQIANCSQCSSRRCRHFFSPRT